MALNTLIYNEGGAKGGPLDQGNKASQQTILEERYANEVDEIQPEYAEVISDLNKNNFAAAWSTAEGTAKDFGTNTSQTTTDPLLQDLESAQGLNQLDPTKQWTPSETQAYYKALGDSSGYTNGAELGQNPYGLWGAKTSLGADATQNVAQEGDTPDVDRWAGQVQPKTFMGKYGNDIAALAIAAASFGAASELSAGIITGDAIATGSIEAAAIDAAVYGSAGIISTGITDEVTGTPVSGMGLLETGAIDALTAGTGNYISNNLSGVEGALAGAGAGAGIGAVKGEITGGNVLEDAAVGSVQGAVSGSGVNSDIKGYLSEEGAPSGIATLGAGVATGVGTAALTGAATNAIPSSTGGSVSTPASALATAAPSTFTSGLESGLGSSLGTTGSNLAGSLGSLVGGLAPYAAVGAIGEEQAAKGQAEDATYSKELQGLAQPSLSESNTLLNNYNTGTISSTDQKVVNTMEAQGQSTIQSAQALSAIAQAAFAQYQAGTLQPGQQAQLDAQTAAQKSQVAQQLASAGITDSTILAAQYQNIDNNALITKQNLLDQNFSTGTAAYDQWLTATTQGQQTIQQGMEFASTSLNTELTNSMAEANIGIGEMNTAITTQMQTDQEYANQVSQLMGTLASAYAKQVAGQRSGSGAIIPGGGSNAGSGGAGGGSTSDDNAGTSNVPVSDPGNPYVDVNGNPSYDNSGYAGLGSVSDTDIDTTIGNTSWLGDSSGDAASSIAGLF